MVSTVSVVDGLDVNLQCRVRGYERPTVTWTWSSSTTGAPIQLRDDRDTAFVIYEPAAQPNSYNATLRVRSYSRPISCTHYSWCA